MALALFYGRFGASKQISQKGWGLIAYSAICGKLGTALEAQGQFPEKKTAVLLDFVQITSKK